MAHLVPGIAVPHGLRHPVAAATFLFVHAAGCRNSRRRQSGGFHCMQAAAFR
jgi:hypothetical protein